MKKHHMEKELLQLDGKEVTLEEQQVDIINRLAGQLQREPDCYIDIFLFKDGQELPFVKVHFCQGTTRNEIARTLARQWAHDNWDAQQISVDLRSLQLRLTEGSLDHLVTRASLGKDRGLRLIINAGY